MEIRPDWLARVREDVVDPDRRIVDPHHHLWSYDPPGPYRLPELHADTGDGHRVEQTVYVECMADYRAEGPAELQPVGETESVARAASDSAASGGARIAGIVGFADLTLAEHVRPVLEAHVAAGDGIFRGIRHVAAFDESEAVYASHTNPGPRLYTEDPFRRGFAQLAPMGLRFDAWSYHHQIPLVGDLARAFPETTIILDHLGGPLGVGPYAGRREEVFTEWKRNIAALAQCANVVVKLGGFAMALNGWDWHHRAEPPTSDEIVRACGHWYAHVIDCFGPSRCMFESNFPVDKESLGYRVLWNAFKKMADSFSEDEKDQLFRGTAQSAYGLTD